MCKYFRFRNFHNNFIFANSIKRHISDVKNLQLRQDLPTTINERVIVPFCEGFIFTKLRPCENFLILETIQSSTTHDSGYHMGK